MATLTIQVVSGLGTNQTQLTFSATDSQRILTAWQNLTSNPGGTQPQFTSWLAAQIQSQLNHLVTVNEQTTVTPPAYSTATS